MLAVNYWPLAFYNGDNDKKRREMNQSFPSFFCINYCLLFHAYIICFLMVAWNTQIFIFGWCENILMGISLVEIGRSRR
jgi:hypothetical protein